MLEKAGPGSLLLLDEIAAGTDPAQGGALARAVVERLADVGARIVATTHYTQVKAMASVDPRVEVAALEYSGGRPTYRVVPGAVGESHALAAAERVGLDPVLLTRARDLMEEGERALHDALASLDAEKARAAGGGAASAGTGTLAGRPRGSGDGARTRDRGPRTGDREAHARPPSSKSCAAPRTRCAARWPPCARARAASAPSRPARPSPARAAKPSTCSARRPPRGGNRRWATASA